MNIKNLNKDEIDVLINTVKLVHEYLEENKNADDIDVLNKVRAEYDYSDFEDDDLLELFVIQSGAAYVAYRYIKENPDRDPEDIAREIACNYSNLLDRYYMKELSNIF